MSKYNMYKFIDLTNNLYYAVNYIINCSYLVYRVTHRYILVRIIIMLFIGQYSNWYNIIISNDDFRCGIHKKNESMCELYTAYKYNNVL